MRSSLITAILLLLPGCAPYSAKQYPTPAVVEIPEKFSRSGETKSAEPLFWWESFSDQSLNALMQEAFSSNLEFAAAWERVRQAEAIRAQRGAAQYPQLEITAGGTRAKIENREAFGLTGPQIQGARYQSNYFVQNGLSFEVDLWRRVNSTVNAEELRFSASKAERDATALTLSGQVVDTWLALIEQQALERILLQQIETSETLLELVELRFQVGNSTALDVLEQRRQLAGRKSELPAVRAQVQNLQHQLSVLLGNPPKTELPQPPPEVFPELPPFPVSVAPIELISLRPDLTAVRSRLEAAEYDISAALADRFPRLTIGLNYDFSTSEYDSLFRNKILSGGGSLLTPLVDGGRRRAVVRQQEAVRDELLLQFGSSYLGALQEVEDAISNEFYQLKLLDQLEEQLSAARDALGESRSRYLSGLVDYLRVINAIQSVQTLELEQIRQERALLSNRARLYRALGGSWFSEFQQPIADERADGEV